MKGVFKEKLKINHIKIERARHVGPEGKNKARPRTIVLKLLNFKDKKLILSKSKSLKGTGIYVNEDFAKETLEKRKKLWEGEKTRKQR